MDDHAAGPLKQRLDDNGGDLRMFFFEQSRELIGTIDVARSTRFADRAAIAIGAVDAMHRKEKRAKRITERGARADGHCTDSVSVIGMFKRDNGSFLRAADVLPILDGHFESDFDGGGAVVGKENAFELTRKNSVKICSELFDTVVSESGEQNVIDFRGLVGDGSHDGGMAVAVNVGPPGGDGVDDAAAIFGVEIHALRFGDPQRSGVERFLRKRMPEMQTITHGQGLSRRNCVERLRAV